MTDSSEDIADRRGTSDAEYDHPSRPSPPRPGRWLSTPSPCTGRDDLATLGVRAADRSVLHQPAPRRRGRRPVVQVDGHRRPPHRGATSTPGCGTDRRRFEAGLAVLEHAGDAVAFASAWQRSPPPSSPHAPSAVAATWWRSDRCTRRHRPPARLRLAGRRDDVLHVGAGRGSVRPDTYLVLLRTPGNRPSSSSTSPPSWRPRAVGPSWSTTPSPTPVLQNPLAHGATMALHSATKIYLGGHGDAVGRGGRDRRTWAAALRRSRAVTGGILHPLGAYLLHRGQATLPLRVRAQQASAEGGGLAHEPSRRHRRHYPGLPEADPAGLVGRQMRGPGAMLAFRLAGGFEQAARVAERLQLFTHAVSLGGVDSARAASGRPHPSTRRTRGPSERGPAAALDRPGGRRGPAGRPGARPDLIGARAEAVPRPCRGRAEAVSAFFRQGFPAGRGAPQEPGRALASISEPAGRASRSRRGRGLEGLRRTSSCSSSAASGADDYQRVNAILGVDDMAAGTGMPGARGAHRCRVCGRPGRPRGLGLPRRTRALLRVAAQEGSTRPVSPRRPG